MLFHFESRRWPAHAGTMHQNAARAEPKRVATRCVRSQSAGDPLCRCGTRRAVGTGRRWRVRAATESKVAAKVVCQHGAGLAGVVWERSLRPATTEWV